MIGVADGLSLPDGFVEEIGRDFAVGGLLARSSDFEFRPEQREMAMAVAGVFEDGFQTSTSPHTRASMAFQP